MKFFGLLFHLRYGLTLKVENKMWDYDLFTVFSLKIKDYRITYIHCYRGAVGLNNSYKTDAAVHDQCTLSHIQNKMALCSAMDSSVEYRSWLLTYVRYLTQHGMLLLLLLVVN